VGQWPGGRQARPRGHEVSYVLSPEAEEELADAASFCLLNFGPFAATNFLDTFEAKAALIGQSPGLGTATTNGRRLYPIGRYPFSMLYRSGDDGVRISAIAHHGRGPAYWRQQQ
jgi:plasmid stabilization system protein ParE